MNWRKVFERAVNRWYAVATASAAISFSIPLLDDTHGPRSHGRSRGLRPTGCNMRSSYDSR